MDRTPYTKTFSVDNIPAWRCPKCDTGHLTLEKKDLHEEQTTASKLVQKEDYSEFTWIRYRFAAVFFCSNPSCKEPVSCVGEGGVEDVQWDDDDGRPYQAYVDYFEPKFFEPPLWLMTLPKGCPEEVTDHLATSFSMFFCNPAAAMNSGRIALEALMDHFKIPKINPAKKDRPASLHWRIEQLPTQYKDVIPLLTAVKWLGNAGSHNGEKPTTEDVLALYDVFEYALHEMFDNTAEVLRMRADQINLDKGLIKRPVSDF